MQRKTRWFAVIAVWLSFASTGAVAEEIEASTFANAAPTEPFSGFDRIEVRPIAMGEPYAGQKANDAALGSLQANLDQRLQAWLAERNQRAVQGTPRVLLVEPRVEKIRFISGGARFWAGAFAGTSRVLMKAGITDPATGALMAEAGVYLIENLALEELARDGVGSFCFILLATKFRGATGSPVRPVAMV